VPFTPSARIKASHTLHLGVGELVHGLLFYSEAGLPPEQVPGYPPPADVPRSHSSLGRLFLKKLIVSKLIRTVSCFEEIQWLSELLKLLSTNHTVLFSITEVCTSILHIVPPSYQQQQKLQEVACFMETVGGNRIMDNRGGQSEPGKRK
jgi:hypothetical protein